MKLHHLGEVGQEISEAVVAGVQMVLVLHAQLLQLFMQYGGAFFETIVVILSAVEIDGKFLQGGGIFSREQKWVVGVPVRNIDWISEDIRQHFSQGRAGAGGEIKFPGRLGNQRGALGTDGRKHFGMAEGETQRTESAHGDSGDCSIAAAFADAVFLFDKWDELLQEKIAVAYGAVGRVDVKAPSTFGGDDKKIAELMLLAEIVEHRPSTTVEKCFLVVAQAVEEVEHGIVLWRVLFCFGVVAGGKVDAVMDCVGEDPAVQIVAFDAALCVNCE